MNMCILFVSSSRGRQDTAGWPVYAHDEQHTCIAGVASSIPQIIRWSTPVDLQPQHTGDELLIHYGSPLITRHNTVLVPVKTGMSDGFRVDARRGDDGTVVWSLDTDFSLPPHPFAWVPICGIALTPGDHAVAIPAAGGTILLRRFPDGANEKAQRVAFYGIENYNQDPSAFNAAIQICTPIGCDAKGNLYFGYVSTGSPLPGYPGGIPSGLARVSRAGAGSFASAADISGHRSTGKVVYNCAPAFSRDGATLYVAVNHKPIGIRGFFPDYLCAVNSETLVRRASIALIDPQSMPDNRLAADANDSGSASPTVGPDGDVYFGALESNFSSNHGRGWLLHFDGELEHRKLPNAFGWDDTASIVVAEAVPSYKGPSPYLLLTKYNNYVQAGGNGRNYLALVDPNESMIDPVTGVSVMKTVLKVLGPTPDPELGGVREWCINSAAIDAAGRCAVVNSEDGHVYRWDFDRNALSPGLDLAPPTGEAYTPTVIGPDGAIYAINNARLYSCVAVAPN